MIRQIIQQIALAPDGFAIGRGVVREVDTTLTVELDGKIMLYDVAFDTTLQPTLNSSAVVFYSPNQAAALFIDEVDNIELTAANKITLSADEVELPKLKAGAQKIELTAPLSQNVAGLSLSATFAQLLDALVTAQVATPAGVGTFAPATIAQLNIVKNSLQNLIQ